MNLGLQECAIIFVVVLLLFGAKRLPQMGQHLGEGIKNFRGAVKALHEDDDDADNKGKSR